MKLVVLESPNKVEKVRHQLGPGYEVPATVGHFRDLPERRLRGPCRRIRLRGAAAVPTSAV